MSTKPTKPSSRPGDLDDAAAVANAPAIADPDAPDPIDPIDATLVRPARKDEPGPSLHLAPIRQRIESIFWTCKDLLTLERHGARTLPGIKERVLQRLLCLAACISLNHKLGRPSRALVDYIA